MDGTYDTYDDEIEEIEEEEEEEDGVSFPLSSLAM
jgi:hypothetical protein